VNSYLWGVVSAMPYFDGAIMVAKLQQDSSLTEALQSVHIRLARAARALDDMLAALSNPLNFLSPGLQDQTWFGSLRKSGGSTSMGSGGGAVHRSLSIAGRSSMVTWRVRSVSASL